MKLIPIALAACLLFTNEVASAQHEMSCDGRARLQWATCDHVSPADGSKLVVRYCFGKGALGSFTGQMKVLVQANHVNGTFTIGDESSFNLVAMQGCIQDDSGEVPREFVGDVTMHVAARGHGYYSVTVQTL